MAGDLGFVYLIGQDYGVSGLVKIGRSTEPSRRLQEIQNYSPVQLRILWAVRGGSDLETYLHREFAQFRKWGEWFDLGDDPIMKVAEVMPPITSVILELSACVDQKASRSLDSEEIARIMAASYEAFDLRLNDLLDAGYEAVSLSDFQETIDSIGRSRGWGYDQLTRLERQGRVESYPPGSRNYLIRRDPMSVINEKGINPTDSDGTDDVSGMKEGD